MKKHIEGVVFSYDLSSEKLAQLGSNYNSPYNGYDILKIYLTGEDGVIRKRSLNSPVSPWAEGFKEGMKTGLKQKSSYIYSGKMTAEEEQKFIDKLYEDLPFLKCVNDKIMISGINGVNDYTEKKVITEKDRNDFKDGFCHVDMRKSHSAEAIAGKNKGNLKVFFLLMANPTLTEEEVCAVIPCNHRQYQDYKSTGKFLDAYVKQFAPDRGEMSAEQLKTLSKPLDQFLSKVSRDTGLPANVIRSAFTIRADIEGIRKNFKLSPKIKNSLDTRSPEEKVYSYFKLNPPSERNSGGGEIKDGYYPDKIHKILRGLIAHGFTVSDIGKATGVSASAINKILDDPSKPIRTDVGRKFMETLDLTESQIGTKLDPRISYMDEVCNAVNESRDKVQKILRDIKENPEKYKDIDVKPVDQSNIKKINDKLSAFVDKAYDDLIGDEEQEEEDLEL